MLKNFWRKPVSEIINNKIAAAGDTLYIPFIDDFSSTKIFPNHSHWLDSNVFVNSDYSINPLSIGIATFEGLDKYGNPYDNSNINASGVADVLTSKPINLFSDSSGTKFYSPADSIFLTFFYQRKGWGDTPETNDSLVVEFFNPSDSSWSLQWSKAGGADTIFSKAKISVTDTAFFKNGFQFRFKNYGTLTGSGDHWHIDYVVLKENPNLSIDTVLQDVALAYRAKSLLQNHTAVPWQHYTSLSQAAQQQLMKSSLDVVVRNNDIVNRNSAFADFVYDSAGTVLYSSPGGSNNFPPTAYTNYSFPLGNFFYPPNVSDSATFSAENTINPANQDYITTNNQSDFRQDFYNFYSYDDGTAEAAYNLTSFGAQLAYRFDLLKSDTLRALQIHFVQLSANATAKTFNIAVWNGSMPNPNLVYQQAAISTPDYTDSINGFATYSIKTVLPLSGSVFVGYIQSSTSVDNLNLGFDRNINSNSRMYYNTTGTWTQSAIPGSYMIRPVFGDSLIFASVPGTDMDENNFTVFPNPAPDYILLKGLNHGMHFEISDLFGRKIVRGIYSSRIDISMLANGIYHLTVAGSSGKFSSVKFAVAK